MDLAAEVKNPNASWGARELSYSFTVLDQAARTLGSVDGKGFLMPGETRWFVAPAVSVSGRIADVRFTISKESVGWQKFKSFSQDVSLATRNVWFRKIVPPEIGFAELSGEVENRSSFTLDSVEVSGTIFDSKSAVIALGKTLLKTVKPSEVRHFSIKWQSHFEGDAARWEAQAKSNFLLDQNFILKYGE
ncbi:MAG: hypothetical protein HYS57_03240 [Parcubacteria group bacterium]|nr:hypothetical protein [Parcubacteria group bacterium]